MMVASDSFHFVRIEEIEGAREHEESAWRCVLFVIKAHWNFPSRRFYGPSLGRGIDGECFARQFLREGSSTKGILFWRGQAERRHHGRPYEEKDGMFYFGVNTSSHRHGLLPPRASAGTSQL